MLNKKNTGSKKDSRKMPDITSYEKSTHPYILEKVGMRKMEIPIRFQYKDRGTITYPSKIDALVNLTNKNVKGIHMSRLYLLACAYFEKKKFSSSMLSSLLDSFIASQQGISDKSFVLIDFQYVKTALSLLSGNTGSRYYPVKIRAEKMKKSAMKIEFEITLTYSSTCPCSAALSKQLINQKIEKQFSGENLEKSKLFEWIKKEEKLLAATPHSQRSFACVRFEYLKNPNTIDFDKVIRELEAVLVTPVQAAVKRNDEQEFARLNAENLMFCEDAARKLKNYFEKKKIFKKYFINVSHEESLHAHDAVAEANG